MNTAQLRLGMYIVSIEGAWIDLPFWKASFALRSAADLEALRGSDVDAVWIDTARGLDVDGDADADAAPAPAGALDASLAAELAQAALLLGRAKQVVIGIFGDVRMGKAIHMADLDALVDEFARHIERSPAALLAIARLKNRDEYTYQHSLAVSVLMLSLARNLKLDAHDVQSAALGGLLHDIGKALVPLRVLNKPGSLSAGEVTLMRDHPDSGVRILRNSGVESEIVLDVCLHHHERVDGRGYPRHLKEEQISTLARMCAICDVYDAMTSVRAYKQAFTPAGALAHMYRSSGHFDRRILDAFIHTVGIYPVGSLVRLHSERLAVVVRQNPVDLTRPCLRVFRDVTADAAIEPIDIDLAAQDADDAIAKHENPSDWGYDDWENVWPTLL